MRRFMILVLIMVLMSNNLVMAAEKSKTLPKIEAHSAILMDYKTGKVLWELNAFDPKSNASTTKIMTAIIALENGNLEDDVIISRKATLAPKVKMNLKKDEVVKLKYLLYALMLESYNDSAVAIAEHIGGSVENFCKMMTEKAKQIGAKDTLFETPNGLDAGNHHSTAYDLAIIAKYALDNKEFMKIINSQTASFKSNLTTYKLNNKNRLLNEMPGANGMKTGFTNKAGHCFVGTVKRDNMQLISGGLGKWLGRQRSRTKMGGYKTNNELWI